MRKAVGVLDTKWQSRGILRGRVLVVKVYADGEWVNRYPYTYVQDFTTFVKTAGINPTARCLRLFTLAYRYDHPPYYMLPHELAKYRQRLCEILQERITAGEVVRLSHLAAQLSHVAAEKSIRTWAQKGKIAAVKMAGVWYLDTRDVDRYVAHFMGETLQMAAHRLHVKVSLLNHWRRTGKLATTMGPDGVLRLGPEQLTIVKGLTLAEVARMFGRSVVGLAERINDGTVATVQTPGGRRVPMTEVARLTAYFNTINPGFEWLHERYGNSKAWSKKLCIDKAAKRLRLSVVWVRGLARRNFLPWYPAGLVEARTARDIPQLYVEGLLRYAGFSPTLKQIKEYNELCQKRQSL